MHHIHLGLGVPQTEGGWVQGGLCSTSESGTPRRSDEPPHKMGNVEMVLLDPQEPKDPAMKAPIFLQIVEAINMPDDHLFVEVGVRGAGQFTVEADDSSVRSPSFRHSKPVDLGFVHPEDVVTFAVHSRQMVGRGWDGQALGTTEWRVGDLVRRPVRTFPLSDSSAAIVLGGDGRPAFLVVRPVLQGFPAQWPPPRGVPDEPFPKHVMLITRGTRGDLQPFAALAKGLAERFGWKVTLCTELRYKEWLQRAFAGLKRGRVQFRPTGGDTSKKVEACLNKRAMSSKSEVMQALMLSRSEKEFFSSEPAIFHWAEVLRPQGIVYGFTMANIAMICSEALHIPIVGFILQPSVIPSTEYTPVTPLTNGKSLSDKTLAGVQSSHGAQVKLRWAMEDRPLDQSNLTAMRRRRGLPRVRAGDTWRILVSHDSPLVVPIPEAAFMGKPEDWPARAELTEFIFLRSQTDALDAVFVDFIDNAKRAGTPLVLMAFSSMPVSREDILSTAALLVEKCSPQPAVLAMVGNRPEEKVSRSLQERVSVLKTKGLLLEGKQAPFGLLLPQMDVNIIHGGLGTTAEALRAGKPCIVTGILLMDQRFWGSQVASLGVSPGCCHINDFEKHCVKWVSSAMEPGNEWAARAQELAKELGSSDGVQENTDAIAKFLKDAEHFVLPETCVLDDELETCGHNVVQDSMGKVKSAGQTVYHQTKGVLSKMGHLGLGKK